VACRPTMRGRRRGYSSAPGFRVRPHRYGSCGYRHALQVSARAAPFLCARGTDGLFKNLAAIVWMHSGVAVAVKNNSRDRRPAA